MQNFEHNQTLLQVTVFGVGGCGGNSVALLNQKAKLDNLNFISVNTDIAALNACSIDTKLLIGERLTKGFGAGADAEIGQQSALESKELLLEAIQQSDLILIVTGLGGGTGTGASPVIAEIAKELGIACIVVATLPFKSESVLRNECAQQGLIQLTDSANAVITLRMIDY